MLNNLNPTTYKWRDSRGKTWDLRFEHELSNKRYVPIKFSIQSSEGEKLTQQVLREVPFNRWAYFMGRETGLERKERFNKSNEFRFKKGYAKFGGKGYAKFRGSEALSDREMQLTADSFLAAYRGNKSTIKMVAFEFGISESAAKKRIALLRQAGLLPPSQKKKGK